MMDKNQERQYVAEGKNGSETAFRHLVEENQKRIYNLAYRMMGNHEDAQDVAQEAFFKAWSALPNFKGDSSFSTWLYRLASNTAIDHIRKKKRQQEYSLTTDFPEDEEGTEWQVPDENPSPESSLLHKELGEVIGEGLGKLPEHYRLVLTMRELGGMSYQEIATTLDSDLGTVKSRIARGRTQLREFLIKKEIR